ncbi:MAG: hypothetical protein HN366_04960 [Deltaproteobacteria bacterium]|jgi:hypothetical protein|nr:hypothetical protein [Deltaproteobacteria bacterium]
MAAPRRYKIGTHRTYDQAFDAYKTASPVLNSKGSIPNVHSLNLSDKNALRSHILERVGFQGDPKKMEIGWFQKGETGQLQISDLKSAEQDIEEIKSQFEHHKQTQINMGMRAPEAMSNEMLDKMFRAEARHDIVKSEIETLERLLKNFTDRDEKIDDSKVLKGGPRGMGKLRHGILAHVDGQNVEADSKGVLRIDDPRSKYDGMKTCDYYDEIVKPWGRANAKLLNAHVKKSREIRLSDPDAEIKNAPKAPWPEPPNKKQEAA